MKKYLVPFLLALTSLLAAALLGALPSEAQTRPGLIPFIETTSSATSTLKGGLNLLSGCVSISGVCIGVDSFSTSSAAYWLGTKSTSDLSEGSNLYFTNARARSAISSSATGLTFNTGTGALSLTSGYVIPLTASTTEWATTYGWGNHASQNYFDKDTDTTTNLTEGSKLFYTDARVGSYISGSSTVPHIGGTAYGDLIYWTGSTWGRIATSSLGISSGSGGNSKWATSTGSTITPNGGGGLLVTASSTFGSTTIAGNATTTCTHEVTGSLTLSNWKVATTTTVCRAPEVCQFQADGTADDVQIQAAINAVATKKGTVHIKPGTYDISTSTLLSSGVTLEGEGTGTILKAGTNLNNAVIKSNGRINSAVIRDLYIDGNSANQSTSGTCIEVNGYYNWFLDVWALDCKDYGIYLNASVNSSESRIIGGRYNAGTNAIRISDKNNDFYVDNVTAYGGTDTIYNAGGGGRFSNIMVFNGSASSFKTNIQTSCFDCRFSVSPIGVYIDSSLSNIIGLWEGAHFTNVVFSEITDHAIYENVGSGISSYLNVEGWFGQNSTNADLSLDGAGTHRVKIKSSYPMLKAEKLSTGTVHAETYIRQPDYATTTAPTSPVLGMIYLDSGANTVSGSALWRRYNGSSWTDLAPDIGSYITGSSTLPVLLNYWTKSGSNLNYTAGSVSIGTTTAATPFNVDAGVGTALATLYTLVANTNPAFALDNNSNSASAGSRISFRSQGTERAALVYQLGTGVTPSLQFLTASAERMRLTSTGNLGLGTTSPLAKLSVHANSSETNKYLFEVASSTASATTSLFSITNTGSTTAANGFNITAGCYAVNGTCLTSGGSGFSTTSADHWDSTKSRWATTSAAYFLSVNQGAAFSTTSADHWDTTKSRWATTSADYYFSQKTTANLTENTNLYYTDARVGSYITGSTTLPGFLNYWTKSGSNINYVAGSASVGTTTASATFTSDSGVGTALATLYTTVANSNPAFALDNQSSNSNGGSRISFRSQGVERAALVYQLGAGVTPSLQFFTASVERMRLTSTGNLGIGTTTPFAKLSVHAFPLETNKRLFSVASSTASATTTLFTVLNSGFVGIGLDTPTTAFHVNGTSTLATTTTAALTTTSFGTAVKAVSASYVVTSSDNIILMTTGATSRTVTLPSPSANSGKQFTVKKVDSGVGTIDVFPNSTEQIDSGGAGGEYTMNDQFDAVTVVSDGTNWHIINEVVRP
jgi:hypothetical protein